MMFQLTEASSGFSLYCYRSRKTGAIASVKPLRELVKRRGIASLAVGACSIRNRRIKQPHTLKVRHRPECGKCRQPKVE